MIRLNYIILKHNLVFVIIFIFSVFISGCETVNVGYVAPDKIPNENDRDFQVGVVKIVGVFMKDGTYIDLTDKNAKLDITNNPKNIIYNISPTKTKTISLSDAGQIKINIVKGNILVPIAIVGGVVVLSVIMLFLILAGLGHFGKD